MDLGNESIKKELEEWEKQRQIFFGLYLMFKDDNLERCENSFVSLSFGHAADIEKDNYSTVKDLLFCGYGKDIATLVPKASYLVSMATA